MIRFSSFEIQDHLSIRSLRFNRESLIYIVIRRHVVVMRMTNYNLNATQICNAAKLNKKDRLNYMKIFRTHCDITINRIQKESQHFWISFKDDVFLCQALKLFDELKQMILQTSMNISTEEEITFWIDKDAKKSFQLLFWIDRDSKQRFSPSMKLYNKMISLWCIYHRYEEWMQRIFSN